MNTTLLDNRAATKSISNAKAQNKPVDDFLEITGIKKSTFKFLSPNSVQREVDTFIGNGTATILLRRSQ